MYSTANTTYTHGEKGNMFSRVPRAQWTMELDYCFVHTLAQYTVCNSVDGLVLKNKYVDPAIIRYVESALKTNINLQDLEMDLSVRYPNKKKEHRSLEALQLLVELKNTTPSYSHQQLNHKHINMWTRSIVPFRHLHESGALFKGKTVFHKDCKRFVKVIMEVVSFAVYRGSMVSLGSIFGKKPGQGSKLLEQWLNAMFDIHANNMLQFMMACATRLARTFIETKPIDRRTREDQAILADEQPNGKMILSSLKEYLAKITEYEGLDSMIMPYPSAMGASMDPMDIPPSHASGPPLPPMQSGISSTAMYLPVTSAEAQRTQQVLPPAFSSASNSASGTPEYHEIAASDSSRTFSACSGGQLMPPQSMMMQSQMPDAAMAKPQPPMRSNYHSGRYTQPRVDQHHVALPHIHTPPPPPPSMQGTASPANHIQDQQQLVRRPEWQQRLPPPSALLHKPSRAYHSPVLPPITTGPSGVRRSSYSHGPSGDAHQQHQQRYRPYSYQSASEGSRYQASGVHGYREKYQRPSGYAPNHPYQHQQYLPPVTEAPLRPPMAGNGADRPVPPMSSTQCSSEPQQKQQMAAPMTNNSVFK
ncbi:hypothetical protein EV175_000514 [Coemansia sp. RSA 1933]|nr:hypothetical protein EV175_000514 [Coemansia sp. RSA 1933]